MDDAVGVGLCLRLARASKSRAFPPLLILLSEQEECGSCGAERISEFLIQRKRVPAAVITIDTTPLFHGDSGVALYCEPWARSGHSPSPDLRGATAMLRDELCLLCPQLRIANNSNDYVAYASRLNTANLQPVASVAIEPSIYPYHQRHEEVFVEDVLRIEELMLAFLSSKARRKPLS